MRNRLSFHWLRNMNIVINFLTRNVKLFFRQTFFLKATLGNVKPFFTSNYFPYTVYHELDAINKYLFGALNSTWKPSKIINWLKRSILFVVFWHPWWHWVHHPWNQHWLEALSRELRIATFPSRNNTTFARITRSNFR